MFSTASPPRHKKEVPEFGRNGQGPERLDETRKLPGVHIAVRRICQRRRHEGLPETLVPQLGMIVTYREGGEVPVTIQVLLPFQRIDDDRTMGPLEVDDHVESVHEDVFFQDREDLIGRNFDLGHVALLEGC